MPLFAIAFAIGVLGFFMFIVSARTSSKVRSIQGTPQVNTPDSHDLDWHVETARDSTPGPTPLGPWKPRSNTHITIQNADGTSREATDAERQMIERSIRGSGH